MVVFNKCPVLQPLVGASRHNELDEVDHRLLPLKFLVDDH